jgi:hypothetical protein
MHSLCQRFPISYRHGGKIPQLGFSSDCYSVPTSIDKDIFASVVTVSQGTTTMSDYIVKSAAMQNALSQVSCP